jgi:hypothetical protein
MYLKEFVKVCSCLVRECQGRKRQAERFFMLGWELKILINLEKKQTDRTDHLQTPNTLHAQIITQQPINKFRHRHEYL